VGRFAEIYRRSLEEPAAFWGDAAELLDWVEPWERVLDDTRAPFYRWFTGGRMNTCANALDRHVDGGRADQLALVYDSPVTDTKAAFTYRELRDEVARFAGALRRQGVGPGDRVIVYMPMVPEAVVAMLACARIGAVHSVVFGGFAANELATRIEDAQPKGIVRDNGGHAVALAWSMKNIYDTDPGEVYWAASDIGWTVGHSYTVYGPLLHGCTSVLYEGKPVGTPDAGAFWRVCAEHGVGTLFTAPTAFRAIRQQDPDGALIGDYDLSKLRALFLAGERCDPETLKWAEDKLDIPVIDHYWQTETGWPVVANCLGVERLPVKPGSPTCAVPGWDLRVMDKDGNEAPAGEIGALVAKLPMPPGSSPTLWNAEERYRETYLSAFPGSYQTADAGYIDEDGYVFVMARTDDIINTAGHRLSTGAMEEVLAAHPDVAECAVVGVADDLRGQLPVGFLVLKAGVDRPHDEIVAEVVELVRDRIGPVAAFKSAVVVARLPKTRSGKILRGTMRRIADGEPYTTPATIDDPAILDEVGDALRTIGYAEAPVSA